MSEGEREEIFWEREREKKNFLQNSSTMNYDCCFRPRFCTDKANLGWGQPWQMR